MNIKKIYSLSIYVLLLLSGQVAFAEDEFDCPIPKASVVKTLDDEFVENLERITVHVEEKTYGEFFHHPILTYLIEIRRTQRDAFKDIDLELSGLIDEKYDLRIDLTMADTIDQISLLLEKKKWSKYKATIYKTLGQKPIENFFEMITQLEKLTTTDPEFLKEMNKVQWQEYNIEGHATISKPMLLKKGRFARLGRMPKVGKFNQIAHDPESQNVLRLLAAKKQSPFITNRSTIAKINKMKKSEVTKIKDQNEKEYTRLLLETNKKDEQKYGKIADLKFNNHRQLLKRYRIKGSWGTEKSVKDESLLLFNEIDNHPQKSLILRYINKYMAPGHKLTTAKDKYGNKHLIMSPTFLHHHKTEIAQLVKSYTYDSLVSNGDDEVIYEFRRWVKNNKDSVSRAGIKLSSQSSMPSRDDVIDNYDKLLEAFPNRPWEGEMTFQDAKGNPIILGQSKTRRVLGKVTRRIKSLGKRENMAAIATSAGTFALTGNPYVASIGGAVVRDVVYAQKYGHGITETLKTQTPKNIVGAVIFGSGFGGNDILPAVLIGGASGAGQGYLNGKPIVTSALVGAGGSVFETQLNQKILGVSPGDSTFSSVKKEVTRTAIDRSGKSALVAYLDDGESLEGSEDNEVTSDPLTGVNIIVLSDQSKMDEVSKSEFSSLDYWYEYVAGQNSSSKLYGDYREIYHN